MAGKALLIVLLFTTNVQAQTKEYPIITKDTTVSDKDAIYDSDKMSGGKDYPFFYDEHTNVFFEIDTVPQIDSSKIYYKKYVLYQALMNKLVDNMNRKQNPIFDKRIFPAIDSCEKYKKLLNNPRNNK